ncbi:MAG: hypothetical protein ACK4FK_14660 [Ferrovibrio sp.]|uniref:hypothetical protein n=1 Tax=Ferrovibrio sp. TaxID=1917215 RepID=UPI00391BB6EC
MAMIAGVGYWTACEAIFGPEPPQRHNTHAADLRRGLKRLGIALADRLSPLGNRSLADLATSAIVKVNPRRNGWHWVVWDAERQRILDPRQPSYQRYRVVSLLPVR